MIVEFFKEEKRNNVKDILDKRIQVSLIHIGKPDGGAEQFKLSRTSDKTIFHMVKNSFNR